VLFDACFVLLYLVFMVLYRLSVMVTQRLQLLLLLQTTNTWLVCCRSRLDYVGGSGWVVFSECFQGVFRPYLPIFGSILLLLQLPSYQMHHQRSLKCQSHIIR
jgi:hypothetical protein